MILKIIDKIVDFLLKILMKYKNKRRLEDLRKRDPFIYP
jgi:hypothetical protein